MRDGKGVVGAKVTLILSDDLSKNVGRESCVAVDAHHPRYAPKPWNSPHNGKTVRILLSAEKDACHEES